MLDTGYAKPSYHNLCSNSGIYITVVKGFHSLRCKTEQVSIVSDWGHLEFSPGGGINEFWRVLSIEELF